MNKPTAARRPGLLVRIGRYAAALASETASMLNVAAWFRRWDRFPLEDADGIRRHFLEHGWVIVRGVFTREEVEELRAGVHRSEAEGVCGDVLANPYLGGDRFVLDERVLALARMLLPGEPVHFGDATWSAGQQPSLAFHKDNPDRRTPEGPDWKSPYTVLRLGLYLQDHARHSGGLALRDRSDSVADINTGTPFAAPTEVGDLVAWSLRTTHSGFATRPRLVPAMFLPLTLMTFLVGNRYEPPRWAFRPLERTPRMALFATFGVDDPHLHRFVRHSKTCHYAIVHWQSTHYDESLRAQVAARGVRLLDVPAEVRDTPLDGLHHGFVPLPDP